MIKYYIDWQYCKDPNEINEVIRHGDPNWDRLESASQIINIIWNSEHRLYQVFWKVEDNEDDVFWEENLCKIEVNDGTDGDKTFSESK